MQKSKTVSQLLKSQSKAFKKRADFSKLDSYLAKNPHFASIRLNLKYFKALNKGILPAEYVAKIFISNKVASNHFFAIFQTNKREYLKQIKQKKQSQIALVNQTLTNLSKDKKAILKQFLEKEKTINKKITLWRKYFYNISLTKAKKYVIYDNLDFYNILLQYLKDFDIKYHIKTSKIDEKKILIYALEINEKSDLQKQYRILSKKYHPDTGGSNEKFILLQKLYNQYESLSSESGFFSK